MNLSLTPEQFRKLIELAYMGEWVINAHHDTEFQDDEADKVLQELLKAMPAEDIGRDEETGDYFMRSEWVEGIYDRHIMDYDDHVFWEELTERLAQRDLAGARGISPDDINRDDDLLELRPLEERYRQEFEDNGVERLELRGY